MPIVETRQYKPDGDFDNEYSFDTLEEATQFARESIQGYGGRAWVDGVEVKRRCTAQEEYAEMERAQHVAYYGENHD